MDNYKVNHELNEYSVAEGIEFTGLMPKFMEAVGMTIGAGGKSSKLFEFNPAGGDSIETVDTVEIMNQSSDEPTPEPEPEPEPEPGPGPEPEPEPEPEPVETVAEYDFIYNEASYDAALGNPTLQRYYEDHPEEDCYNTAENRPCNYNDRLYKGTIDGEEVNANANWASENAQMITIGNDKYYAAIFYGFDPQNLDLYNDVDLTESAGKTLEITQVSYNENCPHSWKAVNKDAFPWCAVNLPVPFSGTIKFAYDETNVVERQVNTEHGYYIEQIASLFGEEYKIDENDQTTFDDSKLVVTLITKA